MLVGSRPSRTTLSHRLQGLLGAPCWLLNRSEGPLADLHMILQWMSQAILWALLLRSILLDHPPLHLLGPLGLNFGSGV